MNDIERASQFFSAYFHEDWRADFETPDDLVSDFLRNEYESPPVLKSIAAGIRAVCAGCESDEDVAHELERLGCYYWPRLHGALAREWLLSVADRLEAGQ